MCVVRTRSLSPTHSPVEKPIQVCGAFPEGCARPSIQIVCDCSYVPMYWRIAISSWDVGSLSFQIRKLSSVNYFFPWFGNVFNESMRCLSRRYSTCLSELSSEIDSGDRIVLRYAF